MPSSRRACRGPSSSSRRPASPASRRCSWCMMLSGPRVFLAMARDGMVPRAFFADVHPKFRTPWKSTILIGVFVAIMAGLLPIDALLHLTNIGTLFAFVIVCAAVLIMRQTNPDAERPFRAPFYPFVPILGIATTLAADVFAAGRELVPADRLDGGSASSSTSRTATATASCASATRWRPAHVGDRRATCSTAWRWPRPSAPRFGPAWTRSPRRPGDRPVSASCSSATIRHRRSTCAAS